MEVPIYLGLFFIPIANFAVFPNSYTDSKWLFVFIISVFAPVFALIDLLKKPKITLPKQTIWVGSLVLGVCLLFTYIKFESLYCTSTLKSICFFSLFIYFGQYFSRGRYTGFFAVPYFASFIIVFFVWLIEFWQVYLGESKLIPELYSSSFGNANMLGQYCATSILLAFVLIRRVQGKLYKNVLRASMPLLFIMMISTFNRSSLLGLALSGAYLFYINTKIIRKKHILLTIGVLSLFFLYFLKLQSSPLLTKNQTLKMRTELHKEAIELIKNNPMGVGTNFYAKAISPYQLGGNFLPKEKYIYLSPHNEFLRILAEEGVLFFLLILAIVLCCLKKFLLTKENDFHPVAVCFLILLIVELLFQFPLQLPFPFFGATALGAYICFVSFSGSENCPIDVKKQSALMFLSILMLPLLVAWVTVKKVDKSMPVERTAPSCHLLKDEWENCEYHISNLITHNRNSEALSLIKKDLRRWPLNMFALRHLIRLMAKNDMKYICEPLSIYQTYFLGRTRFKHIFVERCSAADEVPIEKIESSYDKLLGRLDEITADLATM